MTCNNKFDTLKYAIRQELDTDVTALDLVARIRGAVNDRITELEKQLEKAKEVRDGLLGYSSSSFMNWDEWTSDQDYSWMSGNMAADTINLGFSGGTDILDFGQGKDHVTFS